MDTKGGISSPSPSRDAIQYLIFVNKSSHGAWSDLSVGRDECIHKTGDEENI